MSSFWDDLEGPAKLLAICVAVFLVAAGLCGMQWFVVGFASRGIGGQAMVGTVIVLGIIELIAMAGAAVVGFVALILMLVGFRSGKRGPSPGAQTLFPPDNNDHDKQP
jgi:hypothetical protein